MSAPDKHPGPGNIVGTRESTALMARCIDDCAFGDELLAQIKTEPRHRAGLIFDSEVMKQVGNFAGFITKIRHNHLWEDLPYTRFLLAHYNIEADIFSAYCRIYQAARRSSLSRTRKTDLFALFLSQTMKDNNEEYPALLDVLTHEKLVFDFANEPSKDASTDTTSILDKAVPDATLEIRGVVRCAVFNYVPMDAILAISKGHKSFQPSPTENRYFIYWKPPQQTLSIFGVDQITFSLVSVVLASPGLSSLEISAILLEQSETNIPVESISARLAALRSISLFRCRTPTLSPWEAP